MDISSIPPFPQDQLVEMFCLEDEETEWLNCHRGRGVDYYGEDDEYLDIQLIVDETQH